MCYAVSASRIRWGPTTGTSSTAVFPIIPVSGLPDATITPTSTSDNLLRSNTRRTRLIADGNKSQGSAGDRTVRGDRGGVFILNTDWMERLPPGALQHHDVHGRTHYEHFRGDGIYFYKVTFDWSDASKTHRFTAPQGCGGLPLSLRWATEQLCLHRAGRRLIHKAIS